MTKISPEINIEIAMINKLNFLFASIANPVMSSKNFPVTKHEAKIESLTAEEKSK